MTVSPTGMDSVSPTSEEAPAATASTNKRRPHQKSRNGCLECRRRRVKCSEGRPRCLACVRHDVPCLYRRSAFAAVAAAAPAPAPAPAPAATPGGATPSDSSVIIEDGSEAGTSNPISASSLPGEGRRTGQDSSSCFTADDMALLHHWTLFTSRTIVGSPHVDHCWQSIFPQVGFRQPFVMHAILSLSALHLAYSETARRDEYILSATRHHSIALQGFRSGIDRVLAGHYADADAIFACSTINIIYIFSILGRLRQTPDKDMKSRAARLLGSEWIPMIRGVGPVIRTLFDRLRVGPLAPLLGLDRWEQLDPDLDANTVAWPFQAVHEAWAAGSKDDAAMYDKAWYTLRRCFMFSRQFAASDDESQEAWGYNREWAGPLVFLHEAPEEYFTRLHQRQPAALVIFSYFAAMLHGLESCWFFEGWGRDIVEVIDQLLGDYWRPWTEWPRDVVRLPQTGV